MLLKIIHITIESPNQYTAEFGLSNDVYGSFVEQIDKEKLFTVPEHNPQPKQHTC